jgi:hypothetical protein
MKKRAFKPGFEFIFSLSLMAILGLPPLVSAQDKKQEDLQININNGDTTINGKNIKDLSADEHKEALKNINQIATINSDGMKGNRETLIVTRKKKGGKGSDEIVVNKRGMNGNEQEPLIADNDVINGTNKHYMRIMIKRDNDSTYDFNTFHTDNTPDRRTEVREFRAFRDDKRPMEFNRRNSQNFMYSNTDNNGISTHVNFHVADHQTTLDYDAGKTETKQLDMLDISDLNIVPEFSAGKTILMFSLPSKAVAEVQLKDSKGNLLWSEKAVNGTFNKSFALGLNGLYYLQIKQGNKVAVKEIMKD